MMETTDLIEIDGRLYDPTKAGRRDCSCRRCASWKEDFGGCIVVSWMEEFIWTLCGLPGPYSNYEGNSDWWAEHGPAYMKAVGW